jgi:signal transduction histidine kinase
LVRDLLDTSRFKAGKIKLKPTRVNGVELLTSLTDSLVPVAKEKGIHLVYEHSELPDFWADYDRLRQLIIIFIDNAIKFTSEGGYITVSTYQKDNMGYICFKDTGVGINPEEIPFIFERFYKVDKARGGSETGTGLGLSIAGQIVQLHGGKINVESDVGKGTTFKVMLPLYDGQDQLAEQDE